MDVPVETCEGCRFDGAQYDLSDTLGTLRAIAPMWRETIDGIPDEVLRARPAPHVWSAAEYTAHSADVVANMGRLLHATLTIDDFELPDLSPEVPEPDPEPMAAALERLDSNVARLHDKAASLDGADDPRWTRTARRARRGRGRGVDRPPRGARRHPPPQRRRPRHPPPRRRAHPPRRASSPS